MRSIIQFIFGSITPDISSSSGLRILETGEEYIQSEKNNFSDDNKVVNTLMVLTKPSIAKWLFAVLLDWFWVAVFMSAAVWIDRAGVSLLAMWAIGVMQHRISLMAHDGAHRCISRVHWLNDALTCFFGFWPLGLGLAGYRKFHFGHHNKVGTPFDPELIHKNAVEDWKIPTTLGKQVRLTCLDLFGLNIKHLFFLIKLISPKGALDILGPVTIAICFGAVVIHFKMFLLPLLWYGGLITTFWGSFRWCILSEHVGTSKTNPTHRLIGTRVQKILFLPHNTDHHWEHHRWPSIPSWNLPKARRLLRNPQVMSFSQVLEKQMKQKIDKAA